MGGVRKATAAFAATFDRFTVAIVFIVRCVGAMVVTCASAVDAKIARHAISALAMIVV